MKYTFGLLALAASAIAGDYYYEDEPVVVTETLVTYTTVTTCPVTETITAPGTTYAVTKLTTSTVVVTECKNCQVHVPGPTVVQEATKVVEVTYTTTCPYTETVTEDGHTYTTTYTTTSVCYTQVPTVIYETVKGPQVTETTHQVEHKTITSLCPVTETKTLDGNVVTVTWTSTSLIYKNVPTVIQKTIEKPEITKTAHAVEEKTITSLCPVTETKTVDGKVVTVTWTSTSLIYKNIPTVIEKTIEKPDVTKYEHAVEQKTITSLCPVTETKTIDGDIVTVTWTSTSLIYTNVPTVIHETVEKPDVTKYEHAVEQKTVTSLCPVTETKTVDGKVVTVTWTSTSIITEHAQVTEKVYTTLSTTEHLTTDVYVTTTCPVTTYTTVVHGETHVVTETKTHKITVETSYVVTDVIPVTHTKHVEVTEGVTIEKAATVTQHPVIEVVISGTVHQTITHDATHTVVKPTTQTVEHEEPSATSSDVPAAAATGFVAPGAAVLVGLIGAMLI